MAIYPELRNLSLPQLIERFWVDAPDGSRYAFGYYAEVAEQIRERGVAGITFLLTVAHGVEIDRRRAILSALADAKTHRSEARDLLLESLSDPRPLVVAEAIDGLAVLADETSRDAIVQRRAHRSPYVRAAAVRYLGHVLPQAHELRAIVDAALQDAHHAVRTAAIDALADLDDAETLAELRSMIDDPHPDVREAAEQAIERVAPSFAGAAHD